MSRHREESFGKAGGSLRYHSLITAAAGVCGAERWGKQPSITQNTISREQGWKANGCFHREGNLLNGSIMEDGITCDCYPSQAQYDGQGV